MGLSCRHAETGPRKRRGVVLGEERHSNATPGTIVTDVADSPRAMPARLPYPAAMGLLDRFRRRPAEPSGRTPQEQRDDARDLASSLVDPGFLGRTDAIAAVTEMVEDDSDYYPDLSGAAAAEIAASMWDRRLAVEAEWSDEGDYERLLLAFGDLESRGVVARMNFTCCQTCGHEEIGDERADDSRGYTFFHQQDAEHLAPGASELFLAFGAFGPDPSLDADLLARSLAGEPEARSEVIDRSEERIANEVVDALTSRGLRVEWSGNADQRIQVVDVDWRKRLPVN